jgi:hypothetical protein
VLVGKRFNLDLSARLFVIAFLLVAFNALEGKGEQRGTGIAGWLAGSAGRQCWQAVLAELAGGAGRGEPVHASSCGPRGRRRHLHTLPSSQTP